MARRAFGIVLRQADVDVLAERRRDLVLEELSETAMPRIDAAHQFAFIEAQREGVIGLSRAGLPCRFLTGQHHREAIEVGHDAAIDGFVEREQSRLMRQELADGDLLFALLRELRPVRGHPLFVVEPAARVGECQGHGRQALRGRVDDDHRVLLPRLARLLVANAAPEIDDLLAVVIGTAGATQLAASLEVLGKRLAHRLEAATDVSLYRE